ncbi:hypothetical protein FBZ89_109106 [Nitrospirillum amazonense]|uniref:Uncharacterized protein n=1 Tax=Nitrospirillum amazonense TaxID=28077 RepID=A0A560FAU1_9PROT|nr:hypothetical protein [Nitrospirillum amazonense]TWB18722.1 hypothetical protein FBZ89_109106 [Nitrospirillum amazonense]
MIRKGKVEARVYFGISNSKAILLHGHAGKRLKIELELEDDAA